MTLEENSMKKKKLATTLVLLGVLYAILPDPIPGPFDDLLLNVVLDVIAFVVAVRSMKTGSSTDDAIANSAVAVNTVKTTVNKARELKREENTTCTEDTKVPEVKSF